MRIIAISHVRIRCRVVEGTVPLAVEELLEGKPLEYPRLKVTTFKRAPRKAKQVVKQERLL